MLWSDRQRTIEDISKPQQRQEFNGVLNLGFIEDVQAIASKSQKKIYCRWT